MAEILPTTITAGVTLDLTVTLTAYPADCWTLAVLLRGATSIDLSAVADGRQHHISVDAATTAGWPAGDYWYSARVTDGAAVIEIDEGTVSIKPDLATMADGFDGRSHIRKVLAAVEAVIEGRATLDQERYRINNRELFRTPIAELIKLRSQYRADLRQEEAAKKGGSLLGRTVRVRF